MNSCFRLLLATLLVGSLMACAGGSGGGDSSGPTYSDSEISNDLTDLNAKEKALEKLGLRFQTNHEFQTGMTSYGYKWDENFLTTWSSRNTVSSASINDQRKAALTAYAETGEALIKKYDRTFNTGGDQQFKMKETVKQEILLKTGLARKTIQIL